MSNFKKPKAGGHNNTAKTPLWIHRAQLGTYEGFVGFLKGNLVAKTKGEVIAEILAAIRARKA